MRRLESVVAGIGFVVALQTNCFADDAKVQYQKKTNLITLDAYKSDIKDVISKIFQAAISQRYELTSGIKGSITIHLKDVSPETALRASLGIIDADFSVSRNIYYIRENSVQPVLPTPVPAPPKVILPVVPSPRATPVDPRKFISLRINGSSFDEIANEIAAHFGLKLQNNVEAGGFLSVGFDRYTLDEAMSQLADIASLKGKIKWSVQNSLLIIDRIPEVVSRVTGIPNAFKQLVDIPNENLTLNAIVALIENQTRSRIVVDKDVNRNSLLKIGVKRGIAWNSLQRVCKSLDLGMETISNDSVRLLVRKKF